MNINPVPANGASNAGGNRQTFTDPRILRSREVGRHNPLILLWLSVTPQRYSFMQSVFLCSSPG
jgi:hypothetical protein